MGNDRAEREKRSTPRATKQSGKGETSTGYTRVHWANVTLTPAQKSTIRETPFDVERFWDTLSSLLETGHKLVITPKGDKGFIGATVLGVRDECPNKDCGISGEGGTLDSAVRSLWFKMELLDYQWFPDGNQSDDDFR